MWACQYANAVAGTDRVSSLPCFKREKNALKNTVIWYVASCNGVKIQLNLLPRKR